MTAKEIQDNYFKQCDERHGRCRDTPDAAEAIDALHPFTVSRVARFCDDERDLAYIRRSTDPVHLLGDALTAPSSKVPPKEKAAIWLDYLRCAPVDAYLARLVSKKVPGCEDFRNLSPDCSPKKLTVHAYMSERSTISSGEMPAASISFQSELVMVTSATLRSCSTGLSDMRA